MMRALVDLARPFTLLMPVISFCMAALIAALARPAVPVELGTAALVAAGALGMACLAASANAINQVFDVAEDRVNKPDRPLPSGRLGAAAAGAAAALLAAAGWGLASFGSPTTRILFFLVLLSIFVYSVPPFRTKRLGWWANVTIAVPRGCLLRVAGWSVVRSAASLEIWSIGLVFLLFLLGGASTKDFADVPGDRACGIQTLPVRFGAHRAARMIAPFLWMPWLLLPLGAWSGVLHGAPTVLSTLGLGLAAWGAYVARVLPHQVTRTFDGNPPAWRHMYLMLIVADIGLALAYGAAR